MSNALYKCPDGCGAIVEQTKRHYCPSNRSARAVHCVRHGRHFLPDVGCHVCATEQRWDREFIDLAGRCATWSKDRSRQVGAVIVSPDREVIIPGYNGFPPGANDSVESRHERPAKYLWTEHAERNAVLNAGRVGLPLKGYTMYVSWFPCADCARAVARSGISTLVCGQRPDLNDPQWGQGFAMVGELLKECGVTIRFAEAA